jgi:hypothetical protein
MFRSLCGMKPAQTEMARIHSRARQARPRIRAHLGQKSRRDQGEKGCRQLILGSGQDGNVQLSPEADAFFAKKNCEVVIKPTPQAIRAFNEAPGKKIGLFHVTC